MAMKDMSVSMSGCVQPGDLNSMSHRVKVIRVEATFFDKNYDILNTIEFREFWESLVCRACNTDRIIR